MKILMRAGLALALCSARIASAYAAGDIERQTKVVHAAIDAAAVPATGPILVDGKFDEAAWELAPRISDFVQREPAEGEAPTYQTEARVAYDATALYVAVRAFDLDRDKVVGILTRRDQRSPSDWIRIVVDSYNDKRSAYEFGVNPVGVKTDRYYFDDGNSDDSWDAVWDVKVEKDGEGWRAEFRIPFSQLRFNNTGGGPMGFAVIREVGRLAETVTWPLISRSATGFVSQFGEVRGLRSAGAPKKFEILPYTVGTVDTYEVDAANPLVNSPDPGGTIGVDVKYAITSGLTLTATANPDFGQVEADPAVVNLDAFETFFPERRPFFVEGSGTFRFNMDCNDGNCTGLFYSRRIGREPQGTPDTAHDEYSKQPDAATIIGAGKLTGRAGKFSVGALTAVTAMEDAEIAAVGDLDRRSRTIEPLTGYTVVRARREYANQSALGFMATSTNRQIVPAVRFLADNAFTAGLDYDWRFRRLFSLSGYWAGSHIKGSTEAISRLQENNAHAFQRPDADYVEADPTATTLQGQSGSIAFSKIAGGRTRFNSNVSFKTPGFDSNDLGYMRRADEKTVSNWFQYRDFVPGKYVRQWMVNLNQWAGWNFGGDRLFSGGNVNTHWTWANYYNVGLGLNLNGAPFRDRSTRGGPGVRGNASRGLWYYAGTDNRKTLSFRYNGYHEADEFNTVRHNISPGVTWRVTGATELSGFFNYGINHDDAQWVTNQSDASGGTHNVFGRIDQTTLSLSFRFNYTMTPNLSLQVYAEPFVSAGDYTNFRELVDGRAQNYHDRYASFAYKGNPDFNYRSFRTTNVLRWEYTPGSTLYVVWQQGRQDQIGNGSFDFSRDLGGVFSAPAHNTFLVKLSYWLNM